MSGPYAAYPITPNSANSDATPTMTPDKTRGNFSGSFMASVMGMMLEREHTSAGEQGAGASSRHRHSQPNPFESKHRRADQQGKVVLIEQLNFGDSIVGNGANFIRADVDHWRRTWSASGMRAHVREFLTSD